MVGSQRHVPDKCGVLLFTNGSQQVRMCCFPGCGLCILNGERATEILPYFWVCFEVDPVAGVVRGKRGEDESGRFQPWNAQG